MSLYPKVLRHQTPNTFQMFRWRGIPDGAPEKLKLQEAIPPLAVTENSIHGNKSETLENMVLVESSLEVCRLTIPTRM